MSAVLCCVNSGQLVFADEFVELAQIADSKINESSGCAISRTNANSLWIHNDSGDEARLFLVGLDGKTKAVVKLPDADAVDWEDMCSFESNDQSWLLIGDVGDNDRNRGMQRPGCRLYLIREPAIPQSIGLPTMSWNIAATIEFRYSDGPHNCESIAVDPIRKEILLLTKASPFQCGLYRLPMVLSQEKQDHVALRIASPGIPFATAIDIAPSGQELVIITMFNGIFVRREVVQSWSDAFKLPGQPINLPPRKQGETGCFDTSGRFLFLNSEGTEQPLWRIAAPRQQEDP